MLRYLRNGDIVSGAVMAALGTYVVIQAAVWPYYSVDGPGPGFFPLWYGILMIALALGLIVQAARKQPSTEPSKMDAAGVKRALVVWAGFAVSLVLMGYLGFCIAFTLFTLFIVSW